MNIIELKPCEPYNPKKWETTNISKIWKDADDELRKECPELYHKNCDCEKGKKLKKEVTT